VVESGRKGENEVEVEAGGSLMKLRR